MRWCSNDTSVHAEDATSVGRSVFYGCDGHPDLLAAATLHDADVAVPYVGGVPSALSPRRVTNLAGYIPVTADQFVIALTCGRDDDADVAFNFAVNVYACSYAARNSRVHGKWGKEESAMGQRNPFRRDMDVYVDVLALPAGFYVAVNGRHFVKFAHRVDAALIDTLRVDGDIRLRWVRHGVADVYPGVCPANPLPHDAVVGAERQEEGVDEEVTVPFVGQLPGGMTAGRELVVEGRVELLPCMFYIRIQRGPHRWPPPDVSLSLTARFMRTASDETELTLSSRHDGAWTPQVDVSPLGVFLPGARFRLTVAVADGSYRVAVDDRHVTDFPRGPLPPHDVDTVVVKGCVLVHKVCFN